MFNYIAADYHGNSRQMIQVLRRVKRSYRSLSAVNHEEDGAALEAKIDAFSYAHEEYTKDILLDAGRLDSASALATKYSYHFQYVYERGASSKKLSAAEIISFP